MWNQYERLSLTKQEIANGKHREAVGGLWDEIGCLQFAYLVKNGLQPEHHFLDVGCGSLRGGIHFIRYLNKGHYYGLDINSSLIEAGWKELEEQALLDRLPSLVVNDCFQFDQFGVKFDFAIAHSVFTHLPANVIHRCLVNIDKVLKPGGKFFTTFFEVNDKFHLDEIWQNQELKTYLDKDPYHYHRSLFAYLVDGLSLHMEYIGDWGHPRNQKMLSFRKGQETMPTQIIP
ncbi:class I SAM-dependent methyltransferase [Brevibacillus humidisoli]|uniref:class I SAM-dependent methyltransferase n=1 Tax=Brevibacillus humidisoli TaxID=2895522 RepID=UPI001E4830FB|nr:class I SAM-dependent methyltransferase [Brevibacillus humidisoli]UFJ42544.1 class I SAM-dependent methyltransferase [Brevibacillus humidisoli]